jgi:ABC-type transport system substrate-binding protein
MNDEELLAQRGVSPGDFRTHYLFFDFQSAPFDDVRVRQAFAKAIDRVAVIDFVVGASAGVPSYGILMAGFPDAVTDDLKKYQGFDADTAQKLLADAGFANGDGFPKLELALRQETPLRQAVADAVASELKRNLNIDVTINNMDRKTYMAGLNEQSLQFAMVSYGFDYVDASNFLSVFKTDGRHNWNDAEFEALRTKAAGNANASERANQMVELQEILSERVGSVFLWGELQNQMHKPYMKGTWRNKNAAGWEGLQFPNWNAGFGVQNIYTLYIGDNVGDFNRSPF